MLSVRRLAAIAIALSAGMLMAEEKRPNLVVILVEAGSGADFKEVEMNGASLGACLSPSRSIDVLSSVLSGCHEMRALGGHEFIRPDVPLISEAFKDAGYQTAVFGRWGMGEALPFRPEDRGFSDLLVCGGERPGTPADRWGNRVDQPWLRSRKGWSRFQGLLPDVIAGEAIKWLAARAKADEPFYLQLNLPDASKESAALVLAELKRLDLEKETVTVTIRPTDLNFSPELVPWAGVSIRWPGHIASGRSLKGRTTAVFDLFPTLAGVCQVPMFRDWKGDGLDLSKQLLGADSIVPDRTFFMWGGWPRVESPDRYKSSNFTVLTPQWKLEGLELLNRVTLRREEFETHEKVVSDLLTHYGAWWQSIRPALLDPSNVIVGDDRQKVVPLTWGEWWPSRESTEAKCAEAYPDQPALVKLLETLAEPEKAKALPDISGLWKLRVSRTGHYQVTLRKLPAEASEEERTRLGQFRSGAVHVRAGKFEVKTQLLQGATSVSLGVVCMLIKKLPP
ncbi:MAG: hypothetical protein WCH40_05585, partial [Verrucomicrobiales bacterium]